MCIRDSSYSGDAKAFAWVVPVPSEPKLELSSAELFQELERTTKPQYEFPGREACFDPSDLLWAVFKGQLGAGGSAPEGARTGVDLRQQGSLGPYDYSVIAGDDATALVSWLRENGYRVVPEADVYKRQEYCSYNCMFQCQRCIKLYSFSTTLLHAQVTLSLIHI